MGKLTPEQAANRFNIEKINQRLEKIEDKLELLEWRFQKHENDAFPILVDLEERIDKLEETDNSGE